MSYYNPYQSTESYYDPYQNTQTDTPSASIGQAVKTLAIIGGLNIVGCAATKYLSSSIKSNLKSWSNSTNNSIKKAFATKVITTSNKISDRLAPLKESFHKTSIYQAAQARKATLAPLKGKTGYNLTRVSSAFKSPSAFIGTIAGVWKRNVLQGIGVAYGIDSMLGVTQDIGLQPKSWYDVPGQVSNFGKWLGMSSIFGLALGGGFAGIKATGAGALAGTRKVFGGEFGKKVLSNLAPVHPGVPNDLKYTTAYDGMPSMFNQEVIGALKSQQERKFAANSIKKGFTFASNVSSMFRNVNAAAHTLPDAFRDALKAPKGKRTETAFGTLKAAISNARAILNKPRDKLPSSITHPGIEALNFLQSMSKETSKIQTGSKELTDFFSLISKNSYKESPIDKTIPFLKPLTNRDITSRNWQKEVLSGLSNRFVDQDSAKLLLDNVLNMRVGQNIYRDWRGGKQHGAGVNLNIFDPIYHMRRTASWIANQRFHLPLTKMNMSIGDLVGINEYLTEAPSLVFFNRRPNFQHRDGSIGDLGGDKAQFIYHNKQYLILDGSGAEVVNTNRKLRYSHKSGKNKSYELKTIGINRVKKAAIEAGVDFNEVVNRVDYFDAPTNPFLHFTDRLGIGWPGKIKDLAYQVRNKLEGKKKYQQYVNDFFTAPDIENSRALPIINDIYQTTSQVFSRVLQNKNALMHIASYTHDKTIGDNIVGMAFDDNKLVEIARNLDLKADKFRYRSDFVRAVENIKAFPEQARSHNVVQRLGPFSEMTSFDIMRKDLIEDIFNTDFRQAPAGHSHPLITASTELFEKHIITKKESDYLKLHAKLSVFRDEGLIRGVEHQQQYWPTILKNVKDRAKKHNWEYLDDITNFIANEDIKRPSISLSQQAILPKALREKFPHLNLYTSDVHPYTSVPDNAIGAIKELVERTVDSVTSQFPEWLPFKKRYISHHGFVGNLKYLGGIMGVTVGAFGAYRILDTVTATNPLFDNTMLDEGITGASADVLAKIRFGTSRVADVTGVTAAMKYMHGVAPTSESTIPGAVVGGIAGLVFRSGPMGVAKGILLGGVINRLASPFLPDMTKSHEELTEIYSGREQVPIKKAPLWLLGSTPIEGTKIIGYSPNWYVRAKSRWKESKNMYGSAYRRLIHEPLPLLGFNVGDIIEPYYMEYKNYNTRPYPLTGGAFDEVPIIGRVLSSTVGRIIKPQKTMHQEYLQSDIQPDDNYPFAIRPPTVGEGLGMMKHRSNVRSMGGVTNNQGNIHIPNRHWGEGAAEDFLYDVQQFTGLKGFLAGSVTERIFGKDTVIPTYETAGRIASFSRSFHDLNMGGLYAASEQLRRLVDKPQYRQYGINPIPNMMPNFLPTEFLTGDPYCITGDTLIEVNKNQLIRIDQYDNENITTHKGNFKKPIAFKQREMKDGEKLFEIKVSSLSSFPIKLTEDHPLWTQNGWIKSIDVNIGDYVGYPIPNIIDLTVSTETIDLGQFTSLPRDNKYIYSFKGDQEFVDMIYYLENNQSTFKRGELKLLLDKKKWSRKKFEHAQFSVKSGINQRINRYISANSEFGTLIGYYLSEGFILYSNKKRCGVGFAFHANEIEYHNEVENSINNIFGLTVTKYIKDNHCNIHVYNKVIGEIFSNMLGEGFANKELKNIPKNCHIESLRALFNGDGSYFFDKGKPRLSLKLQNPQLLYQVRKMLLVIGFVGYIVENNLIIRGQAAKECALLLGCKYKETKDSSYTCRHTFIKDNYVWMRIFSKKEVSQETVYGMEIEEDNSFCVAGVATHNTKLLRGELRIPGEAYIRTHPDVKRTMPARSSMIGKTEAEIVQYFTGLISPLAKQEFDILEKGTEFHESIQNTLAAEGLLIQAEALVQDVKNDITGHVDAIIRDGKGGAGRKALEIKTINNDAFQKMSGPKSEHMSQTNFYLRQLKLKNGTIMYVNRENPSEVKTYEVHYSQTMWERDLRKLKKSRAVAATMMEEGVGDTLGYSYSWVDRLRILSDVCILPDTPLFEGTKVINASDVKKETKLLTQSKIFNNVKEIHHNIYNNNIYSFKTLYNVNIGETFFTKDHPIFILDKQYIDLRVQGRKKGKIRYIDNALHRNVRCYNPNIGHFEKAENIKIGNIVILPIPRKNKFTPMLKSKYINHQNLIEKDQYIKIFNKGSRIYHKKTLEINKNSAYFMGLFLSEGSYSFNTYKKDNSLKGIELSFHKDEKKLHSFVIDFIKTQSNGFIKKNDKNNSTKITCGCSVLAHILYENVGHHCYEKRIPKSFFNAPSEIQLQLLKGIFDGDGHCDKNGRFELTSASRNIIYGVYIILLQNGIISSIKCKKPSKIKFNDKNYNTRESFCLRIYGKHSRKFAKLIEYEEYPKTNIKYEKNNYIWIQNGYLCTIIKKIITKNYNGPIINFSVNKDNTFSSLSFLTHNCPNSQETKEAKHIVEQQIKFGVLTDEEVKKYKYALKMKRNRVRDYSLYPNRFKGKVFNPDTELNLQSENEDIKAASEYNLFSRMLGAGWENFTNTNNFLVNKLFAVKDPIEHYKMSRLYGKEYKPWNEPIRAWVEPTFRGLASKTNPIEGGIAFGVLGSVLGGGPIGATIGAAGGVAYGAANGLYRLLSNSTYIPSSVQEKRDIVSFFDAAKYERANMLAELSYGLTKNEYIQQRNNTLTAFNQSESSTVANLFRATPVFEKPYIAAFLNTKNQKERERILKYIPKELAFALKKQWNTDDNKEATSKYIDNVSQTAPKYKFDNSIMDPSVNLSDIQLKTIQEQGLDQFEFGLGWNEQMLRMQESNKKVSPVDIALKEAPTSTLNPGIIRATINDLFFKNNIKCSSQVYINNGDEVNRLNIIVRRDRSLTVINALDYRRKYFNNGY